MQKRACGAPEPTTNQIPVVIDVDLTDASPQAPDGTQHDAATQLEASQLAQGLCLLDVTERAGGSPLGQHPQPLTEVARTQLSSEASVLSDPMTVRHGQASLDGPAEIPEKVMAAGGRPMEGTIDYAPGQPQAPPGAQGCIKGLGEAYLYQVLVQDQYLHHLKIQKAELQPCLFVQTCLTSRGTTSFGFQEHSGAK